MNWCYYNNNWTGASLLTRHDVADGIDLIEPVGANDDIILAEVHTATRLFDDNVLRETHTLYRHCGIIHNKSLREGETHTCRHCDTYNDNTSTTSKCITTTNICFSAAIYIARIAVHNKDFKDVLQTNLLMRPDRDDDDDNDDELPQLKYC